MQLTGLRKACVVTFSTMTVTAFSCGLVSSMSAFGKEHGGPAPQATKESTSAAGGKVDSYSARVVYTGRLMGYLRIPDKQSMQNAENCSDAAKGNVSDDVREFDKQLQDLTEGRPSRDLLLVGTGDNFAPNLFSRVFFDTNGELHHKDDYFWDWTRNNGKGEWLPSRELNEPADTRVRQEIQNGNGKISMDNVGCFLVVEGFDAVVPGQHDFYYGPERLQDLSKFLANPRVEGKHPVRMLAANLVQETTFAKDHKPVPDGQKELGFRTKGAHVEVINVSDKAKVFPWLKEIKFKYSGIEAKDLTVGLCGPYDFSPHSAEAQIAACGRNLKFNQVKTFREDGTKQQDGTKQATGNDAKAGIFEIPLPLEASKNYGVCFLEAQSDGPYCVRFTTYKPLLASQWARVKSDDDPCEEFGLPCLVKTVGGTRVAVFGVVEPDILEYVGNLNYTWSNVSRRYKTQVSATDPRVPLRQLLNYFRDFHGIKVLLAHMPGPQAQELSGAVGGFDIVISMADRARFTPNEELTVYPEQTSTPTSFPPFTAVPREFQPSYDNAEGKEKLDIRLQVLDVVRKTLDNEPATVSIYAKSVKGPKILKDVPPGSNEGAAYECIQNNFNKRVQGMLVKLHTKAQGGTFPSGKEAFALLVGECLRRRSHADLALIQNRDIYWADESFVPNEPLQMTLERLLWKGDFLYVARIPGKTIIQMLKESQDFAAKDKGPLSGEHVTGRDLLFVGIRHDDDEDQYYINEAPVDQNKLYTAATTDYLGLGDTGYAELVSDDPSHPLRPVDLPAQLEHVAAIVYREMQGLPRNQTRASCRVATQYPECELRDDYFDSSNLKPPDTRPGNDNGHKLKEWALAVLPKAHQGLDYSARFDRDVQEHRVWGLSLQKGSLSISANRHKFSEAEQQNTFGGVPIAEVTTPRGHTYGIDQQMTLTRSGRVTEWYASNQATYLVQVNRQTSLPAQTNQKNNLFSMGGGVRLHVDKAKPHAVLVFNPGNIQTQFADPITTIKVRNSTGSPQPFSFRQARTINWLPRIGGRYENPKSWFEFGYEQGAQFRGIREFDFATGTNGVVPCVPKAEQSLQGCVSANSSITTSSRITPQYQRKPRKGLYTDSQLRVPLLPSLTYTMANQGEWFFHEAKDNSTDTLYLDRLSNSLSVPIIGNLALKPEFDVFLFANKLERHHYWEYMTLVSLDFTFDWYRGNGMWNALKYKKPGK